MYRKCGIFPEAVAEAEALLKEEQGPWALSVSKRLKMGGGAHTGPLGTSYTLPLSSTTAALLEATRRGVSPTLLVEKEPCPNHTST
jgi:hypothetical protein